MSRIIGRFVVLTTILFSISAFTTDGQILINQAVVNAAGGFPYKISQPGSYKLSGNLDVPVDVDGIDITSDNVTVDLNGFMISGKSCEFLLGVVCSPGNNNSGISSANNNVTVRNGNVTGFHNGVSLTGGDESIEQMHLFLNQNGISAANAVIIHNNASGNATGIIAINSTVAENVANSNSGLFTASHGFQLTGGVFRGNTAEGNGVLGNGSDVTLTNVSSENNDCGGTTC